MLVSEYFEVYSVFSIERLEKDLLHAEQNGIKRHAVGAIEIGRFRGQWVAYQRVDGIFHLHFTTSDLKSVIRFSLLASLHLIACGDRVLSDVPMIRRLAVIMGYRTALSYLKGVHLGIGEGGEKPRRLA